MQSFIIPIKSREQMAARVQRFIMEALPGNRLEVTIGRYVKKRTNPQCRWLNGVAYKLLGDATGYERDDISEYLCMRYFGTKQKKVPGGKTVDVPLRTTTTDEEGKRCVMTTLEFADFKEFVQRFGAKHGVQIPDPNEESDALRSA